MIKIRARFCFKSISSSGTLNASRRNVIPPGAKIVSQPENTKLDGPFGWVTISVEKQGDHVTVKSRVGLHAERVTPADYPAFKRFCEDGDRALSARLVVEP